MTDTNGSCQTPKGESHLANENPMKKSDINLQQFDDLEKSLGENFGMSSHDGIIYIYFHTFSWDGRLSAKESSIRVAGFEIESFHDFESLSKCVCEIAAKASSIFEAKETTLDIANAVLHDELKALDKTYFQSPKTEDK